MQVEDSVWRFEWSIGTGRADLQHHRFVRHCEYAPAGRPLSVYEREWSNNAFIPQTKLQNIEMKQKTSHITCSHPQTTEIFLIWWILLCDGTQLHHLTTYDVDAGAGPFTFRGALLLRPSRYIALRLDRMRERGRRRRDNWMNEWWMDVLRFGCSVWGFEQSRKCVTNVQRITALCTH